METNYPLYLVFYIDRETMQNPEIIRPYVNSINDILHEKNANTIAIFLPTDGEERVECINPVVVPEVDMANINQIIQDVIKNFDIGQMRDKKITTNPCECGRNPDGTCKC